MNGIPWRDRPLILFGAGRTAQYLLQKYFLKIECFVDNDPAKQNTFIGNIPVFSPEYLSGMPRGSLVIIAANPFRPEMRVQLEGMGLTEGVDFSDYRSLFAQEITSVRQISYLVNHRCNSRCKMCDIWQNQQDDELTPEQLEKLLDDPYFALVDTFLLTGGEPSLSAGLARYAAAAMNALPLLKHFSINVNGLLLDRTMEMAQELKELLQRRGIGFSAGVSIDGLHSIHDAIRGVPGAFERAFGLVGRMKKAAIDVSVSATVMKDNLWHMDEYLSFLRRNKVEAMFKLVRESLTLNHGQMQGDADHFSDDDIYQLKLFYHKVAALCRDASYTPGFANYYQGVKAYLETGKRVMGCSFADGSALHIKQDGKVHICANSGQVLALDADHKNSLRQAHQEAYEFTRRAVCESCISDCMALDSVQLRALREKEEFFWRFFTVAYFHGHYDAVLYQLEVIPKQPAILITGWYGTETVGDKAILGEILAHYSAERPDAKLYVTSMYPYITQRTLKELGADGQADVVPLFSWECLTLAAAADEVCMGGGPLMELEILAIPLWLFTIAKAAGGTTVVFGCGIGPLHSQEKTAAVRSILLLADRIMLRDSDSVLWAEQLTGRSDILRSGDPAEAYLQKRYPNPARLGNKVLACFLREPTAEYRQGMTEEAYEQYQRGFERALAENISALAAERGLLIKFYSMHNFYVGGDDRDFAYRFAAEHFAPDQYWIDNKLTSIDHVAQAMQEAEVCLCMRFHSVLFADTLKVEYLAIDYTHGGKIQGYLKDHGELKRLVDMNGLMADGRLLVKKNPLR